MIQGTMSNAGKSLLTAGILRILKQDGYRVAPFKSQNMALNSFITADGLEMGRAQVMQAEAAGIEPDVRMNPILLKPTSDVGSQVIVNGVVQGNQGAKEYFARKKEWIPTILRSYQQLEKMADIIPEGQLIVNVAKGIEEDTLMTLSQQIEQEIPQANVAVLSGPSHAEEVSKSLPTTCVAGAKTMETAETVQNFFMAPTFRVYPRLERIIWSLCHFKSAYISIDSGRYISPL